MARIRIYDPALCCPTGVCGPSVDPELTRIATAIFLLEKKGVDVKRFNLSSEPQEFVEELKVQKLLEEKGTDALPVVIVNGEVEKIGEYPSNDELASWTGLSKGELSKKDKSKNNITLL
ncbi:MULTISPECIES: arsenite efflux transporter metallochaperone ArsD [Bacillaceae]|uniref:Arsenite efflux transporter metallochaperone ArsD n=1 Tax=Evansella alkalicola TaxID=745819 RepID=A0ABS6JYS3_9BACI|nr:MULTISPECIES: arsenite efflux transporter metallochaperone ArsD [Bacillaceae]MBU9723746.1 arsenite efflux transporter metallochaperone ArsD [Bacillus alkalicola]